MLFAANSCRLLQFKPAINGKRLENHVIQTKKVASDDFCQALCYMETNCVSINSKMDSDQYLCELNDAVAENYPGDLRAAPEFSYFSGEVSGWTKTYSVYHQAGDLMLLGELVQPGFLTF